MNIQETKTIELIEYCSQAFTRGEISNEVGEILWRNYSQQIAVEFPSPKTDWQWKLTAQGWAGFIPVTPELGLMMKPRVEVSNLFRMLEYAYRLNSFHLLEGLFDAQSLEDFYERLAKILACKIADRSRKGLYRTYLSQDERLPYVAGRLDTQYLIRSPWQVKLQCQYQEHTADIEENQILAWTLYTISRSGLCTERVLPCVRRTYHLLQGSIKLQPYSPQACIGRLYHRLNDDYRLLHALCRFFLENSGPSHQIGDRKMLPFIVNMARLYELFIAEWLQLHLPATWRLKAQEQYTVGGNNSLFFNIDLVLYDVDTNTARYVLDTKYKAATEPKTADICQVVAYAEAKGCKDAILVYPVRLARSLDENIGEIRVRSMTFSLTGDLDQAGQEFVRNLL